MLCIRVWARQSSDDARSVEKYWYCHNKLPTYVNSTLDLSNTNI